MREQGKETEGLLCRLDSSKLGKLRGAAGEWQAVEAHLELSDRYYRQSRFFDSYCSLRQAVRAMQAKTGGSHLLVFVVLLNLLTHKFCLLSDEERQQVDSASGLIQQFGSLLQGLVAAADEASIPDRLALCGELKALVSRHSKRHLACYYAALEGVL